MSIGAHLEQRRRGIESRVGSRRKLRLAAPGASGAGTVMNVVVHDLSETGLLLQTSGQLTVGEKIEVVLPHAGPTAASVVWGSNEFFGCRFENHISRATVSASKLQGGPQLDTASSDASTLSAADLEETFGARLRRLRKERQISLIGMARLVNVSKPTVWKWEKDDVRPRQKSIKALAAVLDVSERELLLGRKTADRQSAESSPENSPEDSRTAARDAKAPLSELVRSCKARIAEAAGTNADKVSITIQI